tara:strand:- start:6688 stop:7440 length:753 start_codon:yes stop_codon:yes gene_type:complete
MREKKMHHQKMKLSQEEVSHLLDMFEKDTTELQAHKSVWAKRIYAGMFIHSPELEGIKSHISDCFPEYTIAFDVLFHSKGNEVAWHSDHESLGPFINDTPFDAIVNRHFVSIHFNLTEDGGSLQTLEWPLLSYVNCLINQNFNIFSVPHRMLTIIMRPFAYFFANKKCNSVGVGNHFNNLAMHSVTAGSCRTSYVVRLVKSGKVYTSYDKVLSSMKLSDNCKSFEKILDIFPSKHVVLASDLSWEDISKK